MSHKHRVLLRKFVKEQQENQLSWPLVDSEYHQSDNIFTNPSPDYKTMDIGPSFSDKEVVKRSIVGKPEQFYKIANIAGQQLRFLQPMPNTMQNAVKKLKKTSVNECSSGSSSQRNTRKVSDYGDKKIEQGANFEIKDKYDLLKSMKQINSILKQNEQSRLEKIDKLNISEKIMETHDQRVFERFDQQLQGWQQINRKLNHKVNRGIKKRDQQTLMDSQELYRNRVESLKLFDSLQMEESKCPVITWHNRLRSKYSPQKLIQQEEKQKIQLKNLLLEKIPRKEILGIYNPLKLVNEIDILSNYSKERSKSDYNQLKLNGTSVYQQELTLLKNEKSSFSQPYYFYKNKEVNTEEIIL